ncbi:MAG: glycosyl transferase [Chitinophaga sp.]|nr:glycosyl transferase [Chitinophaga sp.]
MKISGFTIIKNAVLNDYPIVESVKSILPVVDEMIILIGDCEDDTIGLIESINDPKIKIHHSVWDPNLRTGGSVLAVETDKAMQLISKDADWAFYIQGDEVVHEQYHEAILKGCRDYKDQSAVDGLLFKYLHFYGTYDYIGDSRTWYSNEVRVIRNDLSISAYKDAQGFRKKGKKLYVKAIKAYIYHYGWVKSPEQMMKKNKNFTKLWHNDEVLKDYLAQPDFFDYSQFDSLEKFDGTHPNVMLERIARANFNINFDPSKKKFSLKDKALYYFEKATGIRPFDFKNYRLLR